MLMQWLLRLSYGLTLAVALTVGWAALRVLLVPESIQWSFPGPLPIGLGELRLDPLAGVFLLMLALAVASACLYAPGYLRDHDHGGAAAFPTAVFHLFVLSMGLVVLAADAFTFLLAWELMSLLSYFLITLNDRKPAVREAGFIYLVMTHLGTACILIAFGLLMGATGSLSFADWGQAGASLSGWTRTAVFLLGFIGFGSKAGLVPLHLWLPRAHPVAPSHVSALMSGVMVKTALYALVRLVFEFLGAGQGTGTPLWWGLLLMVAGGVSALLGVLYALVERDLKRLLAYSTVENVGIIVLGLGAALALTAARWEGAAALALVASLYHAFNHSVFKGLLFLGAGAVLARGRTDNMEKLGGLIRRMPQTAAFFLAGSAAIAALPPFNGFISEWLTFQSLLLLSLEAPSPAVSILAPILAALLALTGALVLAAMVRAFGITFLALPRSQQARQATEVGSGMRLAMFLLAAAALALGLFPGRVTATLTQVVAPLAGVAAMGDAGPGGLVVPGLGQAGFAAVSPLTLGLFLMIFLPLPWLLVRLAGGSRPAAGGGVRVAPTWACGIHLEPRMEYSAAGFSKPLRLIFRPILQPRRVIDIRGGDSPYFARDIHYRGEFGLVFEQYLYQPAARLVLAVSRRLRPIQAGSLHAYLSYILITLVVLLVVTL